MYCAVQIRNSTTFSHAEMVKIFDDYFSSVFTEEDLAKLHLYTQAMQLDDRDSHPLILKPQF